MAKPPPLGNANVANFNTLKRAFRNKNVALVSALTKDGEPRALVCAVMTHEDGTTTMVPFAVMVWGNPYDMFQDPTED